MKPTKKFFIATLFAIFSLSPFLVSAQITFKNPLKYDELHELIEHISGFLFIVGVPLTTLMVLVGAFFVLTGGGDAKRVKKGKNFIMYAAIGLAIILFARGLMSLLKHVLGVAPPSKEESLLIPHSSESEFTFHPEQEKLSGKEKLSGFF